MYNVSCTSPITQKKTSCKEDCIMGKWRYIFVVSLLVMLTVLNGCAIIAGRRRPVRHRAVVVTEPAASVEVVYIRKAPPRPIVEKRPKRPNKNAMWIPGHWQWRGGKHVWVSGHWDKKPRGEAWVPGKWVKKPRGWVWVPGHWR